MKFTWQATPGHSKPFSSRVLNPKDGPIDEESYSLRIPTRDLTSGITDEELLARFSKGVFGGWVFTPERWIAPFAQCFIDKEGKSCLFLKWLCTAPRQDFPKLKFRKVVTASQGSTPGPSASYIWDLDLLSRNSLPPLGSALFGLLTLFDVSTCTETHRKSVFPESAVVPRPNFAFAEYAGRTKSRSLAASHRFEVTREREGDDDSVEITFSHVRSSPGTGGRALPSWFVWFHVLYSKLLFADGIREVLQD